MATRFRESSIIVKNAGPFDIGRLSQLHKNCFEDGWSRSDLAHLLAMPGSFALIARILDGRLANLDSLRGVGFSVCRVVREECELLSIGVLPLYRGRRVAQTMLRESMNRCYTAGARKMFLEVATDNEPARSLYNHHGFERVGMRKDYYQLPGGTRQDALTLKCDLGEACAMRREAMGN